MNLDVTPELLNSEPVWPGSAALFASQIILYPGSNMVSFTAECAGNFKKE
jgi:hypothetical protein